MQVKGRGLQAYHVVLELAVLIVDDASADIVQKAAVVGHHHAGHICQANQVALQPRHVLDIQMVGGLIQQHDVCLHKHGTGCRAQNRVSDHSESKNKQLNESISL